MEDSGDKGFLSGGVRVSEESKVLTGKSNRGAVISGTDRKFIDGHGVGNNRIEEKVPSNTRWESWGVMNMVGRVLGGKLYMDDELEDVNYSEKRHQVNLARDMNSRQDLIGELASKNQDEVNQVSDMNTWQDVTEELRSGSGNDIKETDIRSNSIKLDLGCPVMGNSSNGNQDLLSHKILLDGRLETEEINDVNANVKLEGHGDTEKVHDIKADVLMPKGCGAQDLLINETVPDVLLESKEVNYVKADISTLEECGEETEKVGEYNVSDLVWGKVRSHPWWPGQLFAPSAASDKAKKYFKKESYLVAYFGDESFAWNEGSKIMPFRMHFSEMEKQRNADGFSHAVSCALDEVGRRVELGLSCPCLAQEVRDEIKFQIFESAGIQEESRIISGGDNVSRAATFSPGDTLQFLESLAKRPLCELDKLQFTISKAQLLAYTRWKGRHQLPDFEEHIGLLENDTQFNEMGEGHVSMEVVEGLPSYPVSEGANDVSSENIKLTAKNGFSRKRKDLSGDEKRPKLKEKSMSVLMSSGSSNLRNNVEKSVRKASRMVDSSTNGNSKSKRRKTLVSTGAATSVMDAKVSSNVAGKSQMVKIISAEIPTPDMVLSKLILAAKKPMLGHDAQFPLVGWLREFRNTICLENCSLADQEIETGQCKREPPIQTADISVFGGTEDSYWTDRIIQSYSQGQTLFESQKPDEKGAQLEADVPAVPKLDEARNDVMDLDTGNQSAPTNVVSEEYQPTALILKFKNLDSIPSVKNLNEIFSRFGILYESETRILSRSKCVKVIFRRPEDADAAFSSAGKYSIFGPSLISYRLRYVALRSKSQKTSKMTKKGEQEQEKEGTSTDAV